MVITNHRKKLINAIIYFAKKTKYCGKTKLLKLLYFLDFCHFKQTGKSVTGLDYYAWEKGPVPRELFYELSPDKMKEDLEAAVSIVQYEKFQKIVPKKKFKRQHFTNRENNLLEIITEIFKEARANEMVEATHLKNEPWDKTLHEKGEGEKIDYLLSIDDDKDSLSYAEARERMEEISEMHEVFGTQ